MSRYDDIEQDHPLDESTSARVQRFDADGNLVPAEEPAPEIPNAPGSLAEPDARRVEDINQGSTS